MRDIPKNVFNRNQACKDDKKHLIYIADYDNDYILGNIKQGGGISMK